MTTSALYSAIDQIENLLQGNISTAEQLIETGYFTLTDNRTSLDVQPESIFVNKPFEVLLSDISIPDGSNFSGDYGDTFVNLLVRVGYYFGGGDINSMPGDIVGLNRIISDDIYKIRRCLEHSDNFASSTEECNFIKANVVYGKGMDRRTILTIQFKLRVTEMMVI